MDGFGSFDEEYKVRSYDQELLDIFYLKEGVRLTTEGTMEFPPEIEKRFAKLLTKNYNKPLKVIRGVEQMVDEYPDSIEIKYQLFSLYQGIENNKGVKKILRRMVEEHPNEILSVSLFMDRLFEPEELKKYEYLLGEGREASSFFGADNEVYAGDYCEYQLTACHYEAFTGDFVNAKRRVRILLDIGFEGEDAEIKEMMQKIAGCMVYEIGKREEEYRRTGKIPKKDEKDEEDEPEVIDDRVDLLMQEHITAILMKMREDKGRMELGLEEDDYWDDDNDYNYIEPVEQVVRDSPKVGRNDPCPCGSGKKYKKCCL